jgi:hypothetical protein
MVCSRSRKGIRWVRKAKKGLPGLAPDHCPDRSGGGRVKRHGLMDEGSNREASTPDLAQSAPTTEPATGRPSPDAEEPLVPPERLGELRRRWETTQTRFVDEPRRSVEEADQLVGEVLRILADTYASERSALEQQWGSGEEASTEALRLILQRYRAFFNRLLTA